MAAKWCEIRNILLDCADIAPSPCKDYCQVIVTTDKVIYRWWKISLRNDAKVTPNEVAENYKDFLDDYKMQGDIRRVFGENLLTHVIQLAHGQIDYLPRLPKHLLVNIVKFLPLEDINHISQTSKLFNSVCHSEELWRAVYLQHSRGANISRDLYSLADKNGWKKLFFTNKLQLQVQLRRQARRRSLDKEDNELNEDGNRSQQTPSPFFISQVPDEREAFSPCQSVTTSLPPVNSSDVISLRHITLDDEGRQSSCAYSPVATPDLSRNHSTMTMEDDDDVVLPSSGLVGQGDGLGIRKIRAK